MTKQFRFLLCLLILLSGSFQINAQRSKGSLSIDFVHFVDDRVLNFDSTVYKNESDQTYTISNFKYYISNIQLIGENGKTFISKEHFLINEDEAGSKKITLQHVPAGNYTSISFMLGVDSLHNCSGAQSGALDPVNAMFWAWNSGYIFLKLEGKSASSSAPGKIIEYHIGGYKEPSNCIRTISLKCAEAVAITDKEAANIQVKVNIAEILRGPNIINFATLPAVTDFHNATMIADNYKDMFSIIKTGHAH